MLKDTSEIVAHAIEQKLTLEQMTKAKLLAEYDGWSHGYINTDQYLAQLYRVMTR